MKKSFNIFSKYRDVLMGIAIISILIFHYTEDSCIAGINYGGIIKFYKTYIGSSGVDIFLLLSGLGLYYSYSKDNNLKIFYFRRIKRVLIPYLIVSIPVYIWYDFFFLSDGIIGFIKNLFFITIFTSDNILFWYIFFIIICYLIFPLIFGFISKSKDSISIIKILGIILVILSGIIFLNKYYPEFLNKYSIMLFRFIPFILGILIGKFSYNNKKISYYMILFIIGLFSLLFLNLYPMFTRLFLFIFNFSLIFFIVLIIDYLKNKVNIITNVLVFFGKYSLEIYLIHVSLRKILKSYNYPNYKIGYYLLFIIVSIIISIIFNRIIKIIFKKTN